MGVADDLHRALAETHARAFTKDRPWAETEFQSLLSQYSSLLTGTARSFVLGRISGDEAEILTLATDPAFRRQGLARMALIDFIGSARDRGATVLLLEVASDNDAALSLYHAIGMKQVGRRPRYYRRDDGLHADALILSLSL